MHRERFRSPTGVRPRPARRGAREGAIGIAPGAGPACATVHIHPALDVPEPNRHMAFADARARRGRAAEGGGGKGPRPTSRRRSRPGSRSPEQTTHALRDRLEQGRREKVPQRRLDRAATPDSAVGTRRLARIVPGRLPARPPVSAGVVRLPVHGSTSVDRRGRPPPRATSYDSALNRPGPDPSAEIVAHTSSSLTEPAARHPRPPAETGCLHGPHGVGLGTSPAASPTEFPRRSMTPRHRRPVGRPCAPAAEGRSGAAALPRRSPGDAP